MHVMLDRMILCVKPVKLNGKLIHVPMIIMEWRNDIKMLSVFTIAFKY